MFLWLCVVVVLLLAIVAGCFLLYDGTDPNWHMKLIDNGPCGTTDARQPHALPPGEEGYAPAKP